MPGYKLVVCKAAGMFVTSMMLFDFSLSPDKAFAQTQDTESVWQDQDAIPGHSAVAQRRQGIAASLDGLTVFFTQEQRDQQLVEPAMAGSSAKPINETVDKYLNHATESVSAAPVNHQRPPPARQTNTAALGYSARLASDDSVQILANELPCHPIEKASIPKFTCETTPTGEKQGFVLECPHLSSFTYSLCLDSDWQTLTVLRPGQPVVSLQVGDKID